VCVLTLSWAQGIDGKYLQIIQPGDAESDDNGMDESAPSKPPTADNGTDISWDDVAYSLDETLGTIQFQGV